MKKAIFQSVFIICAITFSSCEKEELEPKTESRSYSFMVTRSNSTLSNAIVNIATHGKNFSATTDANGKCKINVPNNINLPTNTIVTVDHSSIKTYCLTVSGSQNAVPSLQVNCVNAPSIVRLRSVALNHLGNDNYSGSANSQFQLPSVGLEKSFSYNLPATPSIMPRLQVYARGIQHPVKIYSNGVLTGTLNNSSSNGDLSLYDFPLYGNASAIYHSGSNVLTIKTGATGNSNDPWDDIEFCGLMLYYP